MKQDEVNGTARNNAAAKRRGLLTLSLIAKELDCSYQVAALKVHEAGLKPKGMLNVVGRPLLFKKKDVKKLLKDKRSSPTSVLRIAA